MNEPSPEEAAAADLHHHLTRETLHRIRERQAAADVRAALKLQRGY